jgi:hypothetical protein
MLLYLVYAAILSVAAAYAAGMRTYSIYSSIRRVVVYVSVWYADTLYRATLYIAAYAAGMRTHYI